MKICRAGHRYSGYLSLWWEGKRQFVIWARAGGMLNEHTPGPGLLYVKGASSHGHRESCTNAKLIWSPNTWRWPANFSIFRFIFSFRFHCFRFLEVFRLKRKKAKKTIFFASKRKKIGLFSLIFALSENERRTLPHIRTWHNHHLQCIVYCKKRVAVFPWIFKLFPASESLVGGIPAGDGKTDNLFFTVYVLYCMAQYFGEVSVHGCCFH